MMRCWHARLFRALGERVSGLSPARVQAIARGLSRVPLINARRRRIAATNIALCFPELDTARQDALARASFGELGIG